ncbi:hypothetical protein [Paraburkholderia terrae]
MSANSDLCPVREALKKGFSSSKDTGDVVAIVAAVWIFAVFLMAVSHWTYRLLEGYIGLDRSFFKRRQQKRHEKRYEFVRQCYAIYKAYQAAHPEVGTVEKERELPENNPLRVEVKRLRLRYLVLLEAHRQEYPRELRNVLATRFGNVLRAFEMYTWDVYGAESIFIWPRLFAVVPNSYLTAISDARSAVDFAVSLVVLSTAIAVSVLARSVVRVFTEPVLGGTTTLLLIGIGALALILARGFYEIAVSAAKQWGDVVKGAFDLYLPVLATTLGYELPATPAQQRKFWDQWNSQFRFHQKVDDTGWVRTSREKDGSSSAPRLEQVTDSDEHG